MRQGKIRKEKRRLSFSNQVPTVDFSSVSSMLLPPLGGSTATASTPPPLACYPHHQLKKQIAKTCTISPRYHVSPSKPILPQLNIRACILQAAEYHRQEHINLTFSSLSLPGHWLDAPTNTSAEAPDAITLQDDLREPLDCLFNEKNPLRKARITAHKAP